MAIARGSCVALVLALALLCPQSGEGAVHAQSHYGQFGPSAPFKTMTQPGVMEVVGTRGGLLRTEVTEDSQKSPEGFIHRSSIRANVDLASENLAQTVAQVSDYAFFEFPVPSKLTARVQRRQQSDLNPFSPDGVRSKLVIGNLNAPAYERPREFIYKGNADQTVVLDLAAGRWSVMCVHEISVYAGSLFAGSQRFDGGSGVFESSLEATLHPLPDLRPVSVVMDSSIDTLAYWFESFGGKTRNSTSVRLYWRVLGDFGSTYVQFHDLLVPAGLEGTSGPHYVDLAPYRAHAPPKADGILWQIDPDRSVEESDELNNSYSVRPGEIELRPRNLRLTSDNADLEYQVVVSGVPLPESATAEFYWSTGSGFSGRIGQAFHSQSIPAGFRGLSGGFMVGTSELDAPEAATHVLLVVDRAGRYAPKDVGAKTMAFQYTIPRLDRVASVTRRVPAGQANLTRVHLGGPAMPGRAHIALKAETFWPFLDQKGPLGATVVPEVHVSQGQSERGFFVDAAEPIIPLIVGVRATHRSVSVTDRIVVVPRSIPEFGPVADARVDAIRSLFLSLAAGKQRSAFDNIRTYRNIQESEISQDIYLAAAEHYFAALVYVLDHPFQVPLAVGFVGGYELTKLLADVSAGVQQTSPATRLSVVWGVNGVWDGARIIWGPALDAFGVHVGRPEPTPSGEHVTVSPEVGAGGARVVSLQFESVGAQGDTSVASLAQPSAPPGYRLPNAAGGSIPVRGSARIQNSDSGEEVGGAEFMGAFAISTTASFEGKVQMRVHFGGLHLSRQAAERVRLVQYTPEGQWIDVTAGVDVANSTVVGETSHLTAFALLLRDDDDPALPVLSLGLPMTTASSITLPFRVGSGVATLFRLESAESVHGPWIWMEGAEWSADEDGTGRRFVVPRPSQPAFYRVQAR